MKNIYLVILTAIGLSSCTKYNISGSSDLQYVDGRMLFLKTISADKLQKIDSCDVIHGKFKFSGPLDSVRVAMLSIDDANVLPVVLEDGNIEITITEQRQEAKGTPLNDTLTNFYQRYNQLIMQMEDISHQQSQAIMNGEDMDAVNRQLAEKEQALMQQEERFVSEFISENFDNCLGPYVFQIATEAYKYPILTPWIEALMTKATSTFKENPYVADYMEAAKHNQDVMTGVVDVQPPMPPQPQMPPAPPTPNEMAAPGE